MSSNIGLRLKKYREHKGMSQKKLAELIGVDNTVLSNWERGKYKIDLDLIPDICEALDINPNDLLGFYKDYSLNEEEENLIKIFRKLDSNGTRVLFNIAKNLYWYKQQLEEEIKEPDDLYLIAAHTDEEPNEEELEMMKRDAERIRKLRKNK